MFHLGRSTTARVVPVSGQTGWPGADSYVRIANAAFRDIFVRVLIDDWSGSYCGSPDKEFNAPVVA